MIAELKAAKKEGQRELLEVDKKLLEAKFPEQRVVDHLKNL